MCGIFGWSWKKKPSPRARQKFAFSLGILNDQRGGKGFGVYVPLKDRLTKRVGTFAGRFASGMPDWVDEDLVACHTRFPSQGAVSKANCHPFRRGPIVGAHNGCLSNHQAMNKEYARNCQVDSEHIFLHIAQDLPTDELSAYGAIWWYDHRKNGELRVTAFNGGDLAVFEIEGYGVAFSSDDDHLETACEAAGFKHTPFKVKEERVYVLEEGGFWDTKSDMKFDKYTSKFSWQSGLSGSSGSSGSYGGPYSWMDDDDDGYYRPSKYLNSGSSNSNEKKEEPQTERDFQKLSALKEDEIFAGISPEELEEMYLAELEAEALGLDDDTIDEKLDQYVEEMERRHNEELREQEVVSQK